MQTIATFSNGIAAHLAKGRLEDAGIKVYLADEQTVGLAWHLTNALGGIKLQVSDQDEEQARAMLAEDNHLEAPEDSAKANETESDLGAGETETISTHREQNADRALRGALFALLLFPLELYVFWLLIQVLLSDEPIDGRRRRNAIIAAAINLPCVVIILVFVKNFLRFG